MSAYQNNGKPLSQQALYRQKLRLGAYDGPGKPSVGVSSNASDAAALLAASSDLTVNPSFDRTKPAADAQTAALIAKKPETAAWTRTSTDPYADAAAAKAKVTSPSVTQLELGVPASYDKSSIYSRAKTNSSQSMTSRSTPEKAVSKHGLASKQTAPASPLNISKISLLADQNSSLMINKRFNPDQDYRSGIISVKDEATAAQAATASAQLMKHGSGHSDAMSSKRRTQLFQASEVVDAQLLATANAKAAERLDSINLVTNTDLKQQVQLYTKALQAAQLDSEARVSARKSGMIDLGGGLLLPASEVDRLANLIVQPVIDDLGAKADAQRETCEQQKRKKFELGLLHARAKKADEERRQAEKVAKEKAKEARIADHEARKFAEDEKVRQFEAEKLAAVEEKAKELSDLKATQAQEQEELLRGKDENEKSNEREELGYIDERKTELETLQIEKDGIMKPIKEELEAESEKIKEMSSNREAIRAEYEEAQKLNNERAAKVAELKKRLEEAERNLQHHNELAAEIISKREALDKEVAQLEERCASQLLNADQSKAELDRDVCDLEKQKQKNREAKAATRIDILKAHEERVSDAHKINNELPEHLRKPVDEQKLLDTGSLFSKEEEDVERVEQVQRISVKTKPDSFKRKRSLREKLSDVKHSFMPSSKSSSLGNEH